MVFSITITFPPPFFLAPYSVLLPSSFHLPSSFLHLFSFPLRAGPSPHPPILPGSWIYKKTDDILPVPENVADNPT